MEPLGIETLADLKVGQDLREHISFFGLNFILNETQVTKDDNYDDVVDYLKNGKGPLTNPGVEIIGFLKTMASKDKLNYPDVELVVTNSIYNEGMYCLNSQKKFQKTKILEAIKL